MTPETPPPIIELSNVTVVRSGRTVLHDVNLRVEAGEHVAILGPNGCGKSTLIKTLTRELYPLFSPTTIVRLFGQERWNVAHLRSMLGIVTNDDAHLLLTREITAREAVVSGFFGSVGLAWFHELTPEMNETTEELLHRLDIAHLAERPVCELSSGELRRILVARALVHNPAALLMDEPSNSLDVFAQIELRRSLGKLARSGLALLLVTHNLPDIVPEIERVIFIREGRIVADGRKPELLTSPRLTALFGCPIKVTEQDGYYHMMS